MATLTVKAQLLLLSHLKDLSSLLWLSGSPLARLTAGLAPYNNSSGELIIEGWCCGISLQTLERQMKNHPSFILIESGTSSNSVQAALAPVKAEISHEEQRARGGAECGSEMTSIYYWMPNVELGPNNPRVKLVVQECRTPHRTRVISPKARCVGTGGRIVVNHCIYLHRSSGGRGVRPNCEIEAVIDVSAWYGGGVTLLELEVAFIHQLEREGRMLILVSPSSGLNAGVAICGVRTPNSGSIISEYSPHYTTTTLNLEGLKREMQEWRDSKHRKKYLSFVELWKHSGPIRFDEHGILQLSRDSLVEAGEVNSHLPPLYTSGMRMEEAISKLRRSARECGISMNELSVTTTTEGSNPNSNNSHHRMSLHSSSVGGSFKWCCHYSLSVRVGRWSTRVREEQRTVAALTGTKKVIYNSNVDPSYSLVLHGKLCGL